MKPEKDNAAEGINPSDISLDERGIVIISAPALLDAVSGGGGLDDEPLSDINLSCPDVACNPNIGCR